jgi:prepilin-type processing-associated H-X9-DG protein
VIGGVMACPADEGGSRSYSMNYWASSAVSDWNAPSMRVITPDYPTAGKGFSSGAKEASKLILIVETFSHYADGHGQYMSVPVAGTPALRLPSGPITPQLDPGWRFLGGGNGISNHPLPPAVRYVAPQVQIDYARHRRRGDENRHIPSPLPWYGPSRLEARGRCNIGFADGHVASFTADELANRRAIVSRFVALWSPLDYRVERKRTSYP